jgi:acyl-CoA reductase-like NAD-dependent aldehyde dehydrogenase
MSVPVLSNFIGGTWKSSVGGDTLAVPNPATGEVLSLLRALQRS